MPTSGSLKYATQFGLMAIGSAIAAVAAVSVLPGRLLLMWSAVAFGWVGLAYAVGRPALLMKRADGRQPWSAWLILWPYFLLAQLSLALYRLTGCRHPPAAEARPGLWFARRLTSREFRTLAVAPTAVLDLAAEFPRAAPADAAYRSLPLLDGTVPTDDQLNEAIAWIDEHLREGNVLVHCALGHGRTGSIIVAWLLRHGHATNVEAAIAGLVARRKSFGMSPAQVDALQR
jgi:protein-tyrosine phosphatase